MDLKKFFTISFTAAFLFSHSSFTSYAMENTDSELMEVSASNSSVSEDDDLDRNATGLVSNQESTEHEENKNQILNNELTNDKEVNDQPTTLEVVKNVDTEWQNEPTEPTEEEATKTPDNQLTDLDSLDDEEDEDYKASISIQTYHKMVMCSESHQLIEENLLVNSCFYERDEKIATAEMLNIAVASLTDDSSYHIVPEALAELDLPDYCPEDLMIEIYLDSTMEHIENIEFSFTEAESKEDENDLESEVIPDEESELEADALPDQENDKAPVEDTDSNNPTKAEDKPVLDEIMDLQKATFENDMDSESPDSPDL